DARNDRAQQRRPAPQIGNLARFEIDRRRPGQPGAVPRAILVRDRDDALGAVRLTDACDPATEKIENLWHAIREGHGLDAAGHSHVIGSLTCREVHARKLLEVAIPTAIDARDDQRVGGLRIPLYAALVDDLHHTLPAAGCRSRLYYG